MNRSVFVTLNPENTHTRSGEQGLAPLGVASCGQLPRLPLDLSADKVEGVMIGAAIGDALGMPMETMTAAQIRSRFGFVTEYLEPVGHKWFNGQPAGSWTDDTQLTLVLLNALTSTGSLDFDEVAQGHVKALAQSRLGWGTTTIEGIENIARGISWQSAGRSDKPGRGTGNGVPMKIAPVALLAAIKGMSAEEIISAVVGIASMTHPTSISVSAGLAQTFAVLECLYSSPQNFSRERFIERVVSAAAYGRKYFSESMNDDDLTDRLAALWEYERYDTERIIAELKGDCYVYNSLPFSHMFFVKDPLNLQTLYEVVNAGGDTDTNGSMVGALLGALHGRSIFPEHLQSGLHMVEEIEEACRRFCGRFNLVKC